MRSRTLALALAAGALATLFIAATLPTALYPLYEQAFGFGGITLTLVYAVYVLGNLASLLLFGRLSDQVGRRSVIVPAITIGIVSTLVFLFAETSAALYWARVLSGLATGLGAGTATAWIAELEPPERKAAAAPLAAAANVGGLAVGALLTGVLAQLGPAPLRLPYIVYLALLAAMGVAVFAVPETVARRTRRWAALALRPRLGVPKPIRAAFLAPAVTGFATFALIGFYSALLPGLLRQSLHLSSPLVAGAVVFELFAVAATAAFLGGGAREQSAMLTGLALLPPSLALLVLAEPLRSLPLLVGATAIAGAAAALGYRGSLQVVNRIAPGDQRSEVVSSYLIALFLGNSLPVVGTGLLAAQVGALAAHVVFACAITALAGLAFLTGRKYAR